MTLLVSVSGSIAVGKTTLSKGIAEVVQGAQIVTESVNLLRYLPRFYEDMPRYAFHSRIELLAHKARQLVSIGSDRDIVLIDRALPELITFAKALRSQGMMKENELKIYQDIYDIMLKSLPQIELVILVSASTEEMLRRIKSRGRPFEQAITADYLRAIDIEYQRWISELPAERTFRVDTTSQSPKESIKSVSSWLIHAQKAIK